jgi:hypothetical protein
MGRTDRDRALISRWRGKRLITSGGVQWQQQAAVTQHSISTAAALALVAGEVKLHEHEQVRGATRHPALKGPYEPLQA